VLLCSRSAIVLNVRAAGRFATVLPVEVSALTSTEWISCSFSTILCMLHHVAVIAHNCTTSVSRTTLIIEERRGM
jgi:hypothetical protein